MEIINITCIFKPKCDIYHGAKPQRHDYILVHCICSQDWFYLPILISIVPFQVLLLNNQLEEMQVRYDRATKKGQIHFVYSIRHSLCVLQGTRDLFHEYASRMMDQIHLLQQKIHTMEQQVYAKSNTVYPLGVPTTVVESDMSAMAPALQETNSLSNQQISSTTSCTARNHDNSQLHVPQNTDNFDHSFDHDNASKSTQHSSNGDSDELLSDGVHMHPLNQTKERTSQDISIENIFNHQDTLHTRFTWSKPTSSDSSISTDIKPEILWLIKSHSQNDSDGLTQSFWKVSPLEWTILTNHINIILMEKVVLARRILLCISNTILCTYENVIIIYLYTVENLTINQSNKYMLQKSYFMWK